MTVPAREEVSEIGQEIYQLIVDLYPICRSITGNGIRDSLHIIQDHIPIEIHEIPSGTQVFDWIIPKEWNIRDAFVKDSAGKKIIDFQESNLHILNYSVPVHLWMNLKELKEHLYSLPEYPDWIPYKTSYYAQNWGFCLRHRDLEKMVEGEYEVLIDSTLEDGSMTYGDLYIPGKHEDEILISCHCCHPSMCNDNLSGMGVATFLARRMMAVQHRYSYRFLFIPGTIGSIAWLALHEEIVRRIKHGLVVACAGDSGRLTYKKSRRADAEIDRAVTQILKHSGDPFQIIEFTPNGNDERQYCSPGFNLPVGCLTRTPSGQYPEYHTSADNLRLVQPEYLADSYSKYLSVLDLIEYNQTYWNTNPKCEPQLSKRGLYESLGGLKGTNLNELALLWVLNLSDGKHSLLDIAEQSGMSFEIIQAASKILIRQELLIPQQTNNDEI